MLIRNEVSLKTRVALLIRLDLEQIRPRGYKSFFMLNSAEHEISPAHKCLNASSYEQENNVLGLNEPEKC